jgi:hypothetical protein
LFLTFSSYSINFYVSFALVSLFFSFSITLPAPLV